jgi:hypothetical protein
MSRTLSDHSTTLKPHTWTVPSLLSELDHSRPVSSPLAPSSVGCGTLCIYCTPPLNLPSGLALNFDFDSWMQFSSCNVGVWTCRESVPHRVTHLDVVGDSDVDTVLVQTCITLGTTKCTPLQNLELLKHLMRTRISSRAESN